MSGPSRAGARARGRLDFVGEGGGLPTWRSSPVLMWLDRQMRLLGEAAVEAVEDDLEDWRRDRERRAAR